jgi:spermidine/putrescine transport system permease protein
VEQHLPADLPVVARHHPRLGRRLAPYLLSLPGGLFLLIFFLAPFFTVLSLSLQTGQLPDFHQSFNFGIYPEAIRQYGGIFLRSFEYASIATLITLVVAYPMAYWIAFHGGRYKNTWLFLLVLPFLVSYVIRTLVWQFILSDDGPVLGLLKTWHLLPQGFHILATGAAVIAGIAYNFLPFTALPLYVSLEKIDRNVIEAAQDLYSSQYQVLRRVILPLSIPGIFASFLLTFVPGVGDYVEASILGGTHNTMIGNIIQLQFLDNFQYPLASALSVILMGVLVIGIVAYARALGARSIEEYV